MIRELTNLSPEGIQIVGTDSLVIVLLSTERYIRDLAFWEPSVGDETACP